VIYRHIRHIRHIAVHMRSGLCRLCRLCHFWEVAREGILELLEAIALRPALSAYRPRLDLKRAQHLREPARIETLAAPSGAPGALVEAVEVPEKARSGDRDLVAERVPNVEQQPDLVGGVVGVVTARRELHGCAPRAVGPVAVRKVGDRQQCPPHFGLTVDQPVRERGLVDCQPLPVLGRPPLAAIPQRDRFRLGERRDPHVHLLACEPLFEADGDRP
jgi:hypothetical protein